MRLIFSIPVLVVALMIQPVYGSENLTGAERWSLGGSLSFPFEYNKYRIAIFGFSVKPEASYFVVDGLELSAGVTLANLLDFSPASDARMQRPSSLFWGTQVGIHYFFPVESRFRPFVGADFGVLMNKWEYKQIVWFLQLPIGVSWFVNPNMAIQFGIPISIDFSSTALFEKMTINPGYLGVRAFF